MAVMEMMMMRQRATIRMTKPDVIQPPSAGGHHEERLYVKLPATEPPIFGIPLLLISVVLSELPPNTSPMFINTMLSGGQLMKLKS